MVVFLLIILSFNLHAQIKGEVIVLEAPLFKNESIDSPIIQYLYKGNKVFIHPQHTRDDRFKKDFDFSEEEILKAQKKYKKEFKDPLFSEFLIENKNSDFYKTVDQNGNDAYILKKHIFIVFNDLRELDQKISEHDPTDYRLKEPLPPHYPLIKYNKSRGILGLAFRSAIRESFPFPEEVLDHGIGLESEFNFIWSNHVDWDKEVRLFFGGNLSISNSENSFILENSVATENLFKIAVGPYISYDIWRDTKYRFNLYSSLTYSFLNTKTIKVSNNVTNDKIELYYNANNFDIRFGTNFQIKDVLAKADLILGITTFLQLPHSYSLKESSGDTSSFNSNFFPNNFENSLFVGMNLFVGLQNDFWIK